MRHGSGIVRGSDKPDRHFTQIRNSAARDPLLSMRAKGLLLLMMTFKPGWKFYRSELEKYNPEGREAHQAALRNLKEQGYISRTPERGEGGKVAGWVYIVGDAPEQVADALTELRVNRQTGKPSDGEPATKNTSSFPKTEKEKEQALSANLERKKQASSFAAKNGQAAGHREGLRVMLGDAFKHADALLKGSGYKVETLHNRLAQSPSLLVAFKALTDERYEEVLLLSEQQAAQHADGWESMIGPQFLSILSKPPVKTVTPSGGGNNLVIGADPADRIANAARHTLATINLSPDPADHLGLPKLRGLVDQLRKLSPNHAYLTELAEFQQANPSHPLFLGETPEATHGDST